MALSLSLLSLSRESIDRPNPAKKADGRETSESHRASLFVLISFLFLRLFFLKRTNVVVVVVVALYIYIIYIDT